jgi:hypothetical protein
MQKNEKSRTFSLVCKIDKVQKISESNLEEVPDSVAFEILEAPTKYSKLSLYFNFLDQISITSETKNSWSTKRTDPFASHKIEVCLFLIKFPNSEFEFV